MITDRNSNRHSDSSSNSGDAFEARLSQGLHRIASTTPTSSPGEFDPDHRPVTALESAPQRNSTYLVAAAAAVAAITVTGLVTLTGRSDEQPTQPAASASAATALPAVTQTESTLPPPAAPSLICGTELPVTIDVPSALAGAVPGPALASPAPDGQFAQHWDLAGGTIEVRWPADSRELYDLEGTSGDPSVFDGMTVGVDENGSQARIQVPHIDLGAARSTLTISTDPTTSELVAPCDLVQVRYIDTAGNQTTRGYDVSDLNGDSIFGIVLDPLVTSTGDATTAPDPAQVASCGTDIDDVATGPASATPAEALAAYLESDSAPAGFLKSGYREFELSDSEYGYAIIGTDGSLITLFTVTRAGQDWAVSHVASAGC